MFLNISCVKNPKLVRLLHRISSPHIPLSATRKFTTTRPSLSTPTPSEVSISSLLTPDGNGTSQLSGFSNSREGDWVCPSCGVLSFSWRTECYNCNTIRPNSSSSKSLIDAKTKHILVPKRSKRGNFSAKQKEKEVGTVLKDLLQLSQRSKDYTTVLALSEKHLAARKPLKSSVVATMLRAFGKSGNIDRALDLFGQIGTHPYIRSRPTQYHYTAIITACADNGKWQQALEILDDMREMKASDDKTVKFRQAPNSIIYSAVMNACGRSGRHDKALYVFDTLLQERRLGSGPPKDTILFNQALHACSKLGRYKRAYELYDDMYKHKITRDQVTYGTMLSICDEAGDWVLANEIMKDIKYRKKIDFNVQMYSSAIGAFTKGGECVKALSLFEDAKTQSSLILDAPIYSKVLFALVSLCKEEENAENEENGVSSEDNADGTSDDGIEKSSDSIHAKSHGQTALQLLSEMTKRNLRISAYPLVQAIEVLVSQGMYKEALSLYIKGEANKIFPPCVSVVKDNQRRLDVRRSSEAMCRVQVWSVLEGMLEGARENRDRVAKNDLIVILGNSNKHLLPFVVNILKNNLHSNTSSGDGSGSSIESSNPIRSAVQQDGTLVRVPKASLTKWMKKCSERG